MTGGLGQTITRGEALTAALVPVLLKNKDRRAIDLALAEPVTGGSGDWANNVLAVFPDATRLKLHAARQGMMALTLDQQERKRIENPTGERPDIGELRRGGLADIRRRFADRNRAEKKTK